MSIFATHPVPTATVRKAGESLSEAGEGRYPTESAFPKALGASEASAARIQGLSAALRGIQVWPWPQESFLKREGEQEPGETPSSPNISDPKTDPDS